MQSNSELWVILLGSEGGGKSSAGNTILGKEEFSLKKSAQCIKKHGKMAGRPITVIDTPGRKRDYLASSTPQLYKDEVVRSVSHCPPGPHALCLVITITSPFEEVCKQAVEEHIKLFGENVWNHIIVLFTHGDTLEDMTIEKLIEEQGEPLQEILKRCGNRYHVLNNKMMEDKNQVIQLLEKIDRMVQKNKGQHFEMDKNILHGLVERRKMQEEKAKKRTLLMCKAKPELSTKTDLRVVLLGHQCSGKSSAGDTILRGERFGFRTAAASVVRKSKVFGRQVMVVDTPGWTKNGLFKDTPENSKWEIVRSVSLCPPGPHAFLLVIPVDIKFTDADETSITDHLGLFGQEVWSHVLVLFTHVDWMGDTSIEMYIESEGEALRRVVDRCGNRYHSLNNMNIVDSTQVRELLNKIEYIVVENKGNFVMDKQDPSQMECRSSKKSEDYLTLALDSSGYGSSVYSNLSYKSSQSRDKPPVMS